MKQNLVYRLALLSSVTTLTFAANVIEETAAVLDRSAVMAPIFEVDPFWPQSLPNHWVMGSVVGVSIDVQDNAFIIHRKAPLDCECARSFTAANASFRSLPASSSVTRVFIANERA